MDTLRRLFSNRFFLLALQIVFSVATAVAAVFYIHASVIVIRSWKIALIDTTFFLSAAVLFAMCYVTAVPDFKWWAVLLFFLFGAGLFAAIFFPVQAILASYVNTTVAATAGVVIALSYAFGCILFQCIPSCRLHRRWESIAVTVLLLVAHIGSLLLSFEMLPHGWAFKKFSNTSVTFPTATAEELRLTENEKTLNRDWYESNVLHAVKNGKKPVYDFAVGGKKLSETLSDWSETSCVESLYQDGVCSTITLTNAKHSVRATVIAVYYDATATFEWTVYLKNVGDTRSDTVSDFYAMDAALDITDATLYFSGGSYEKNDDFALYSKALTKKTMTFDTIGGRCSRLYLPFFCLSGETMGATVGIGWAGDWTADFTGKKDTTITISQTELEGYLDADEEIRSPLVSVHLYMGNPLKGFNTFRQRVKDSLPEGYGPISTCFFVGAEGQDDTSNANEIGALEILQKLYDLGISDIVDHAWFDAGWFDLNGQTSWQLAIGDWVVDSKKYPDGFTNVKSALDEAGLGFLLWFEPERVPTTSNLYKTVSANKECANWLLYSDNAENCLWNMGDPNALQDVCERISNAIQEFGVNYYRQDFNIDPGAYWKKADDTIYDGRKGFAENKYVVGEYRFLDYLTEHNPELLIDNCASGGRRIDLEMCRRSIPLWRSDYNCYDYADISEALQYQTYGLSMWLPYSAGANLYEDDVYEYRSGLSAAIFTVNQRILEGNAEYVQYIRDYDAVKTYFDKQYYPLTPCTASDNTSVAMQFGDEKEGVILLYNRPNAEEGPETFVMNGLDAIKTYELTFIEGDSLTIKSGADLIKSGFTVDLKARTAYIVTYKAK